MEFKKGSSFRSFQNVDQEQVSYIDAMIETSIRVVVFSFEANAALLQNAFTSFVQAKNKF